MSVWGKSVSFSGGGGSSEGSGNIKGFEVYTADNKGGTRNNTGKMPNGYFVCFFHDNMSDDYKLNGTTYSYPIAMNGNGIAKIKAETKAVSDNINRGVDAELDKGSAFETTHNDSGSYISVVGGWVGYKSGGTVYKNAVTGTVNSITLNRAHETLLVFVGGSAQGLSQDTIDINGNTYTIANIGAMYDNVYGVYGAIEIDNNSDTVIEVTFPSSCYNFVSIIGINGSGGSGGGVDVTIYDSGTEPISLTASGNVTKNTDNIQFTTGGGIFTNYVITSQTVHLSGISKITINYKYGSEEYTKTFQFEDEGDFYISFGYLTDSSHNEGFIGVSDTQTRKTTFQMWTAGTAALSPFQVSSVKIKSMNLVEVISRAEWNALSTAQKKAYGRVAIQDTNSGFLRGELVNGADYITLLPNSASANVLAEALCEAYSAGKSTLGGLTLTGTPVVQSDGSLRMAGSAVYAACPDVEDASMTVYGVLKASAGSYAGRLLSICKSASASREQLMCMNGSSTASLIWSSYGNDSTISCNVTQKHVYAISADVGTGKSRFYLDGVYLGEKSFAALGYPYWSSNSSNQYTDADFYYGAVVSGMEADATVIANMQSIMAHYGIGVD